MNYSQLLFSIEGRISRSTYWLKYVLPVFIISLVLGLVFGFTGTVDADSGQTTGRIGAVIMLVWQLVLIYPSICVQGKRWHDRNKSAWWVLINLIPIIGGLWSLIECGFLKGTEGYNRFGDDPLGEA